MTDLVTKAKEMRELHVLILENIANDRPPGHGIDRERLANAVQFLRKDRSAAVSEKRTESRAKTEAAKPTIDLAAFLGKEVPPQDESA